MSFIMHRDGELAVPIPPEVERAAIEAGSDQPVLDFVAAFHEQHQAEAKAAAKAFTKASKADKAAPAADPAATPEG